jgi:hypothetical protein
MGKILKNLLDKKILNSDLKIELNKEPSDKSNKVIHISFDSLRLELTKQEFCEIATTLILAEKNLKTLKKIE